MARVVSDDHQEVAEVPLSTSAAPSQESWTAYVWGVVQALMEDYHLDQGMEAHVVGGLPSGGIGSSAAVQVAVLLALAEINQLRIDPMEGAKLVQRAEQRATGVAVGLLDPVTILHGKDDTLIWIDCRAEQVRLHRAARRAPSCDWYLIDSGVPRRLQETPYNQRVAECGEAGRRLGATSVPPVLRDVTPETYRRGRKDLAPALVRRAEHYFSEVKRVKLGTQAFSRGDLVGFGRLMWASAESLTNNLDCGTPEVRTLLDELRGASGVLGASYAGAGWGGLVQVLAQPDARSAIESAIARYAGLCPGAGAGAAIYEVAMGGVSLEG